MLGLEDILGQTRAVHTLRAAHAGGTIAHAYLFTGPPSVGKTTSALAFAAHVLGAKDAERSSRGTHPDLRIFEPRDEGAGNIKVETIRDEILPFARYAPFEGEHAFVIFPDADISFPEAHSEGANTLLKTLEEPKPGVHFILCSSRPQRLLSTIRSRCQPVRFGALSHEGLHRILLDKGIEEEEAQLAASLSGGRVDVALAATENERADEALQMVLEADRAVAERDWNGLSRCAEALAKSDLREMVIRLWGGLYRDIAAAKVGARIEVPRWKTQAETRAPQYSIDKITWAASALQRLESTFDRNVNPQLALERFIMELATR